MRRYPAILDKQAHSVTLVVRLASEFMRPHARRIALAALLMGLAAASTAQPAEHEALWTTLNEEMSALVETLKQFATRAAVQV